MKYIQSYKNFLIEKKGEKDFEDKIKGHGYFKGISTSTARKKVAQMKDQAKMSDDDPNAYKELPGDTKGKKLLKKSKHTKAYDELYGDEEKTNEAKVEVERYVRSHGKKPKGWGRWMFSYSRDGSDPFESPSSMSWGDAQKWAKNKAKEDFMDTVYVMEANESFQLTESVMGDLHYMMETAKNFKQFLKMFYEEYGDRVKPNKDLDNWLQDLYEDGLGESVNEEQKQSTDRSPIDDSAIETGLENKSKETGVPIGILRAVMRRGMAAWKSGHRPGAGQQQWGYSRLNSFLTKAPGTWGRPINDPKKGGPKGSYGADADLAQEVIKGGHDKKLKSA